MHATSATIPTVQRVAEASVAVANTHESTEAKAVNHSRGPQCAHCGWRGGDHAVIANPTSWSLSRRSCRDIVAVNLL